MKIRFHNYLLLVLVLVISITCKKTDTMGENHVFPSYEIKAPKCLPNAYYYDSKLQFSLEYDELFRVKKITSYYEDQGINIISLFSYGQGFFEQNQYDSNMKVTYTTKYVLNELGYLSYKVLHTVNSNSFDTTNYIYDKNGNLFSRTSDKSSQYRYETHYFYINGDLSSDYLIRINSQTGQKDSTLNSVYDYYDKDAGSYGQIQFWLFKEGKPSEHLLKSSSFNLTSGELGYQYNKYDIDLRGLVTATYSGAKPDFSDAQKIYDITWNCH